MADKKIFKVTLDNFSCIGCANCTVLAPQAFEYDESVAKSKVKENAEKTDDDLLLSAAQTCPVFAITLFDKDENQIFPEKSRK